MLYCAKSFFPLIQSCHLHTMLSDMENNFKAVIRKFETVLKLTETLSNSKSQCARHCSRISKSKQHKCLKLGKSKRDIGERVPLPEVKGDVLFGIHPVRAALHAGKRCAYTVFFKAGYKSERLSEIRSQCVKKGVETLEVTAPVLDSLSGNHPHQGVCLDVSQYEPTRICVETDIISAKMKNSNGEPQVWVLPYKVKDTMNMGAILRSCFYFGVDKVLIPAHYSSSLNPVVSKASAGALEVMDIQSLMYDSTLTKCLKTWKDEGGTVVGSTSDESHGYSLNLHKFSTDCPILLILGNEAEGISEKILKYCDVLLCIPNFQTVNQKEASFCVDSLNVSVATGVLLHTIMVSLGKVR